MLQWFTERRSSKILPLSIPNLANCIGYILEKVEVYINTLLYSSYIQLLCVAQTASSDIRYAVHFTDNHKYITRRSSSQVQSFCLTWKNSTNMDSTSALLSASNYIPYSFFPHFISPSVSLRLPFLIYLSLISFPFISIYLPSFILSPYPFNISITHLRRCSQYVTKRDQVVWLNALP
jgi:hypothetical protein